jgi:hypothetical protein
MLEGGGIPERRPKIRRDELAKALPTCAAKKQWLQILGRITLLKFGEIL